VNTLQNSRPEHIPADRDEPPPFLRTWSRLYASIVVYTCILILALYFMTVTLNR
jgi:hypothetical protein